MLKIEPGLKLASDKKTKVFSIKLTQTKPEGLLTKSADFTGYGFSPTQALLSAFIDSKLELFHGSPFSVEEALKWAQERLEEK